MQRFYLHIDLPEPLGYVEDIEGVDAPDVEGARALAISGVRSILTDELRRGVIDLRGSIQVADEHGRVLVVLPFSDAVLIRNKEGS